ncbi:hypothetical protein CSC75_18470 [Pseudoxanthomonas wuyuanensis]|nr:hypothetical protein CSC75_18470 [Pseudoxanthomonas wuyuanensis]
MISLPFAVILLALYESNGFDVSSGSIAILWISALALTGYLWRDMRASIAKGKYSEADFYNNRFKIVVTFIPALVVWLLATLTLTFGLILWSLRDQL